MMSKNNFKIYQNAFMNTFDDYDDDDDNENW